MIWTAQMIRDLFDEDLNITIDQVSRMTGWSRSDIVQALMSE